MLPAAELVFENATAVLGSVMMPVSVFMPVFVSIFTFVTAFVFVTVFWSEALALGLTSKSSTAASA